MHAAEQRSNDQYQAAQQAGNGGLNVPSLNSVGTNGSGSITDANGTTVGSASYVSNGGADYYGNQAGFNLLGKQIRTNKSGQTNQDRRDKQIKQIRTDENDPNASAA